jgi:hypothetical protein
MEPASVSWLWPWKSSEWVLQVKLNQTGTLFVQKSLGRTE